VIALLALMLPAASAGAHQPKLVRVVKREGAFTATLTYIVNRPKPVSDVTLRIRHGSRLVLTRKLCEFGFREYHGCGWLAPPAGLHVSRIGPSNRPAFLLDIWNGGNHCCIETFIAALGKHITWIKREWSGADGWDFYKIKRSGGHTLFVTGDGRFFCVFSMCAAATVPIRVFAINRSDSFVNVTRHFPGMIRANARRLATVHGRRVTARAMVVDYGSGVLAAWCGDEYLLGKGARCSRVLAWAVKRHWPERMAGEFPSRRVARALNHDLVRWGYKPR